LQHKNLKIHVHTVLLLLVGLSSFAQMVVLDGKILDTVQSPLPNTNILFFPTIQNEDKVRFSITDQDGFYQVTFKKKLLIEVKNFRELKPESSGAIINKKL